MSAQYSVLSAKCGVNSLVSLKKDMEPVTGKVQYRVIYADTDQMGVVYYGNYGKFFEMGRSRDGQEYGLPLY